MLQLIVNCFTTVGIIASFFGALMVVALCGYCAAYSVSYIIRQIALHFKLWNKFIVFLRKNRDENNGH